MCVLFYIYAKWYIIDFTEPIRFYDIKYLQKNENTEYEKNLTAKKFFLEKYFKKNNYSYNMFDNFNYNHHYHWSLDTNLISENYINSMSFYVHYAEDFTNLYREF